MRRASRPGNVARAAVRSHSRCAWGGCSAFDVDRGIVDNVAQDFEFTGSAGNQSFVVKGCVALEAGAISSTRP